MDMGAHPVPVGQRTTLHATIERTERTAIAPAPTSGSGGRPNALLQDLPRNRSSFSKLPAEIIVRIADHLPPKDLVQLGTAHRHTYGPLKERLASMRYAEQASGIEDLSCLTRMLDDIERGMAVEPSLRSAPLVECAAHLCQIPEADQPEAFKKVFDAAHDVPRYGDLIQAAMIDQIEAWPEHVRTRLFDMALEAVDKLSAQRREQQWLALANQLPHLPATPEALRADRFDALSNRLAALEPARQANLIAALAQQLSCLAAGDGPDHPVGAATNAPGHPARARDADAGLERVSHRYARLQQQTDRLPPRLRGKPQRMLNAAIRHLPRSERRNKYEQALQATSLLPDDSMAMALHGLPQALSALPAAQQGNALERLAPVAQRLAPSQTKPAVKHLMRIVGHLADPVRKDAFLLVLNMVARAPQDDRGRLLSRAADVIDHLPRDDWHGAFVAIGESVLNSGVSFGYQILVCHKLEALISRLTP